MAAPNGTQAITGQGFKFSISPDGTNYVHVGQIKKYGPSGGQLDIADISNLDSPNASKEKLPTQLDEGTISLDIIFSQQDAGQLLLGASFRARTLLSCKSEYPPMVGMKTGLVQTFQAYVKKNGMADATITEASMYTTDLEITGAVNETPGA